MVATVKCDTITNAANTGTANLSLDSSGNVTFGNSLTISTASARFLGDFSNATVSTRLAFQTSTTNGSTGIYALPNGTSTAASWQATNNSDPTNASKILIATNASTDVQLVSGVNGSGTYLPLSIWNSGGQTAQFSTTRGTFTLGVAGTAAGVLVLAGSTSGTATLNTAAVAGSFTYTFTNPGVNVNVGYLEVPQNSQGNGYTTVLSDSGKHLYFSAGGATITIAANGSVAYPLGTVLTFINMNASSCSIAISSDTMYLSGTGTTGTRALAQYGMATAIKTASTTWLISGSGLT
jgi:hypothetical protein